MGVTVAARLAAAGHTVAVANSRGPETVPQEALATGATPVWAAEVADGVDVLIVSVNFGHVPDVADLVRNAPADAVVIDTSNYQPFRDGRIAAVDEGRIESEWVQDHYGRPVVKAWSTIYMESFARKATTAGDPERIALPVAADDDAQRAIGMRLVEETGFEAFDAGTIAESWRFQPATPAYTTDLTAEQLPAALAAADARRSPIRRDLSRAIVEERAEVEGGLPSADWFLALSRAIY